MALNFDVIFMTGPQGSGKGTQGKRLAAKTNFFLWDMGEVLRSIAAQDTPLGREVAGIINNGNFLSDELLIKILEERLPKVPLDKGVIFDGVPRRMGQAEFLLNFLRTQERARIATLYIDLPREDSVQRLMSSGEDRGTCRRYAGIDR